MENVQETPIIRGYNVDFAINQASELWKDPHIAPNYSPMVSLQSELIQYLGSAVALATKPMTFMILQPSTIKSYYQQKSVNNHEPPFSMKNHEPPTS